MGYDTNIIHKTFYKYWKKDLRPETGHSCRWPFMLPIVPIRTPAYAICPKPYMYSTHPLPCSSSSAPLLPSITNPALNHNNRLSLPLLMLGIQRTDDIDMSLSFLPSLPSHGFTPLTHLLHRRSNLHAPYLVHHSRLCLLSNKR